MRIKEFFVPLLILLLVSLQGCIPWQIPTLPGTEQPASEKPTEVALRIVGIQAGHGNGDTGASFCPDAEKLSGISNEADLNHAIATKVVDYLDELDNYQVHIFVGKDPEIKGFEADAFVAIHADQGKPGLTGYKVSRFGGQPVSGLDGSGDASDNLVQALWDEYGYITGLPKDTSKGHFAETMLYYYALGWIDTHTPGAIIEMGWLCDDLDILLHEQDNVAIGIARGIVLYLGDSTSELPFVKTPKAITPTAPGQTTPLIERLEIHLWPEYDRNEMLVIYKIQLTPSVELPTTITIPIPPDVGYPHAVAWKDTDGVLFIADYERTVEGNWAMIHIKTESHEVQLEYYAPLVFEGQRRSYQFIWPGGFELGSSSYEVMWPKEAKDLDISPSPDSHDSGETGLIISRAELGHHTSSSTFIIDLEYLKD